MLSSDHIEVLLCIIEKGSFSAAARALRRTPSAVSMGIANLEAELGLVLFDRSRREPTPTAAMMALLPSARLIDDQLRALRAHADHLAAGVEDRLRIGVAAEIDGRPMVGALAAIAETYPALEIQVRTAPQDVIVQDLHASAIDVCLAYGGLDLDAAESIHALWTETLIAVVGRSHPWAVGNPTPRPIESLAAQRQIVVANADVPMNDARPVVSSRVWKTDSTASAIALVGEGHGWANLPQSIVQPLLASGELVALAFSNTTNGLRLPVYLRLPRHKGLGKAASALVARLQAGVGQETPP